MSNYVEDRLIKECQKVSQYKEWLSGRKITMLKWQVYNKVTKYVTKEEIFNYA